MNLLPPRPGLPPSVRLRRWLHRVARIVWYPQSACTEHLLAAGLRRLAGGLLALPAWGYSQGQRRRQRQPPALRLDIPVISVGGLVLGGSGKTPSALMLADLLRDSCPSIHFALRGYGGRVRGLHRVQPTDPASLCGDEALLLARHGPCWIAPHRPLAGQAAQDAGARLLILDDAHHNPSILRDVSVLVVDGSQGIGNGRIFPAGPLRGPLREALSRCDLLLWVGEDRTGLAAQWEQAGLLQASQIHACRLEPSPGEASGGFPARGDRVFAFAGIGWPEKFLHSLGEAGLEIAGSCFFPDHHFWHPAELHWLAARARRHNAVLVTTEKDHVRLPPDMRAGVHPFPVRMIALDPGALTRKLQQGLTRGQRDSGTDCAP